MPFQIFEASDGDEIWASVPSGGSLSGCQLLRYAAGAKEGEDVTAEASVESNGYRIDLRGKAYVRQLCTSHNYARGQNPAKDDDRRLLRHVHETHVDPNTGKTDAQLVKEGLARTGDMKRWV